MSGTDAKFAHLSHQQRNRIFLELRRLRQDYVNARITAMQYIRLRDRIERDLARKYGIKESMVMSIYWHVLGARESRGIFR